jgi:type I restriction enzyme M protein
MRWSKLKQKGPATMFTIVAEHVFPFLRNVVEAASFGSSCALPNVA